MNRVNATSDDKMNVDEHLIHHKIEYEQTKEFRSFDYGTIKIGADGFQELSLRRPGIMDKQSK